MSIPTTGQVAPYSHKCGAEQTTVKKQPQTSHFKRVMPAYAKAKPLASEAFEICTTRARFSQPLKLWIVVILTRASPL